MFSAWRCDVKRLFSCSYTKGRIGWYILVSLSLLLISGITGASSTFVLTSSDPNLPSGHVWIGDVFQVSLSFLTYGPLDPSTTSVYLAYQCTWVDALGIVLPINACTVLPTSNTFQCSFLLDTAKKVSSYLLSTPSLYVCFSLGNGTPVTSLGTIRWRVPFRNARSSRPKVLLSNSLSQLNVVTTQHIDGSTLLRPIPEAESFQVTVLGSFFSAFLGDVGLSADGCLTLTGSITVTSVTSQALVLRVLGGLPQGQYVICFRRTLLSRWLGISTLVGHPINDILVGSDYYSRALPLSVTLAKQGAVLPGYVRFGDVLNIDMTFQSRTTPVAVYVALDYSFNACVLPALLEIQELTLPVSNVSQTVRWSVTMTHEHTLFDLSNWSLSVCFSQQYVADPFPSGITEPTLSTPWNASQLLQDTSILWSTVGPSTLIVYECDPTSVSVKSTGVCTSCPDYLGDTCSRARGHGVCGLPVPLLSMYAQSADCVCNVGYQGTACEVTVCTPPTVTPTQAELTAHGTYTAPLELAITVEQSECTAYLMLTEVVPSTSGGPSTSVTVISKSALPQVGLHSSMRLATNGQFIVTVWAGGPSATNLESSPVTRTMHFDMTALPPIIAHPKNGVSITQGDPILRVNILEPEPLVDKCHTMVQVRAELSDAERATANYGTQTSRILVAALEYHALQPNEPTSGMLFDVLPHLDDISLMLYVDAWSVCSGIHASATVTSQTNFDAQLTWNPPASDPNSQPVGSVYPTLLVSVPRWEAQVRFETWLGEYADRLASCACSVGAQCILLSGGICTMRALQLDAHTCIVTLAGIGTATYTLRMLAPRVERDAFDPSNALVAAVSAGIRSGGGKRTQSTGASIYVHRPLPIRGALDSSSVRVILSPDGSDTNTHDMEDGVHRNRVMYPGCIFVRYEHPSLVLHPSDATASRYQRVCFENDDAPEFVIGHLRSIPLIHTVEDIASATQSPSDSSTPHRTVSRMSSEDPFSGSVRILIASISVATTFTIALVLLFSCYIFPCLRHFAARLMRYASKQKVDE